LNFEPHFPLSTKNGQGKLPHHTQTEHTASLENQKCLRIQKIFKTTLSYSTSQNINNMMKGILSALTEGKKKSTSNGKINFMPGFDTYTENTRELKRIASLMDIDYTVFSDTDGEFNMYPERI
jgi:nitrogenase molybdenum-iron protein alpha/beta subunit